MWIYSQSTGHFFHNGVHVYTGYSGRALGWNNPDQEDVEGVGPIPAGHYRFRVPYDSVHMGPYVIPLIPEGHNACGRTGFYLHGDNAEHDASRGCIILSPQSKRRAIFAAGGPLLVVRSDEDVSGPA